MRRLPWRRHSAHTAAMASGTDNPYRLLPAVDEVLRDPGVAPLARDVGRAVLRTFAQRLVEGWREEIRAGELDSSGLQARLTEGGLGAAMGDLVQRDRARGIRRAVNVSGVVLNTGLGRAPVHPEVAARMEEVAGSFCVLEVDRVSGERNRRDDRISELLARLVGCEAGIAVNNNAGAALLTMHALATGQEAVVSRGELVEIGGSFRVPEVMAAAGVRLVEVGATNRTRISDYEAALTAETGLLMKVHPSNFRVVGFTSEVDPAAMAELGRRHEVATAWDLGSGLIELPSMKALGERVGGETEVAEAVDSGVDVVTFSGDKLLGGPQAGVVVGPDLVLGVLLAVEQQPDLIIMDIQLPEVSGLDITRWLKDDERTCHIPVLAVTAFAMRTDEMLVREAGCEGYLSKPIQVRSFLDTVDHLVQGRAAA